MKKKIMFSICFLAVSVFTFAQRGGNAKKMSLSVNVGAAMPMGAWGSKKTDTTQSVATDSTHIQNGYASTGFHFDITAGYLFSGNVGGMVLIGGNMNKFDASTYKSVNGFSGSEVSITAKSYYLGEYLVGPFFAIPAGDKIKINIRALVGLVTANTPTITESETVFGQTVSFTISGKPGSGFGYQAAAGLQYNMSDNLGLKLDLAYTGSTIAYKKGITESSASGSQSMYTSLKRTMSVGLFTVSAGVAIGF